MPRTIVEQKYEEPDDEAFMKSLEQSKTKRKEDVKNAVDIIIDSSAAHQEMEDAEKVFISFVTEQLQKMDQHLLFDGSSAPSLGVLNLAISSHAKIMIGLTALYEQNRWDKTEAQDIFDEWFADKYVEISTQCNTDDKARNKWLNKDEIERLVKVKYKKEYSALKTKVNLAEAKRSFLQKTIDMWQNYSFSLNQLSKNSLAELGAIRGESYEGE